MSKHEKWTNAREINDGLFCCSAVPSASSSFSFYFFGLPHIILWFSASSLAIRPFIRPSIRPLLPRKCPSILFEHRTFRMMCGGGHWPEWERLVPYVSVCETIFISLCIPCCTGRHTTDRLHISVQMFHFEWYVWIQMPMYNKYMFSSLVYVTSFSFVLFRALLCQWLTFIFWGQNGNYECYEFYSHRTHKKESYR